MNPAQAVWLENEAKIAEQDAAVARSAAVKAQLLLERRRLQGPVTVRATAGPLTWMLLALVLAGLWLFSEDPATPSPPRRATRMHEVPAPQTNDVPVPPSTQRLLESDVPNDR